MNNQPPIGYERFGFTWGAVLAGLLLTIAIDIFFAEIGLAVNVGVVDSHNAGTIVIGNAIAWVLTGLTALFAGSWLAGRFSISRNGVEGGLHGLSVWATGGVLAVAVAVVTAGAVATGLLSTVAQGLKGGASLVQAAAPKWDNIRQELSGAMSPPDERTAKDSTEGSGSRPGRASAHTLSLGDRTRLLELAEQRYVSEGPRQSTEERSEMVQLLAAQTGTSPEDASRTVDQWDKVWERAMQKFEAAKQDVSRKAEEARKSTAAAALWTAVAMVLGALTAFAGGVVGFNSRARQFEREESVPRTDGYRATATTTTTVERQSPATT